MKQLHFIAFTFLVLGVSGMFLKKILSIIFDKIKIF